MVEPVNPITEKILPPLIPQPQENHEQGKDTMYSCHFCPVGYKKFCLLRNHIQNIHFIMIKDLIKCDMCPKSFNTVQKLNSHKKIFIYNSHRPVDPGLSVCAFDGKTCKL